MSDRADFKNLESNEGQEIPRLSERVTQLGNPEGNRDRCRQETEKLVFAGTLPSIDLAGDPLASSQSVLDRMKTLSEPEKVAYAKALCKDTFTNNPRFEAAVEKEISEDGKSRERLVDFDLVKRDADGRIERRDLLDTTRGAAERADYIQRVHDVVNPAVKAFEEMRGRFQRGNLVSDSSEDRLSPPTKITGSELELALGFSDQLERELKARGFSADFCKDALAAFRRESIQHDLEISALDTEIAELNAKPRKTAEDRQDLSKMQDYRKKSEKEQNDWSAKKNGIALID